MNCRHLNKKKTIAMRYTDVSKTISHALRHEPWLYELELDAAGWVPVEALLAALRAEKPAWAGLSEADLVQTMAQADKQRYEMRDGKFRALYGHSTPQKLAKEPAEPPAILFHGTAPKTVALIRKDGLRPMGRQYVHLSVDIPMATQVGRRKAKDPVILRIRAGAAHAAGVRFYRGNDLVWLADAVAPAFIE
jgi:putative RNA 2'-phosphotransferase